MMFDDLGITISITSRTKLHGRQCSLWFFCAKASCPTGSVSAHAICTCMTTSKDQIEEINWEKKNRLSFHWRHGSKSAGSTHFFFGPAKQVCHRPSNCAARQDTYVLTADNILKTKHGLQDTQIFLTKTKMPTSLVQEGWRKLFGWRLLNHRLGRSFGRHWLDLVTLQGLVHCLHLLFVDLNVWCLDTKNPFRQQSDLSSTFGRRPDEQARFPIRHLKLQNPWYRGDSFHSKRCLWTKNGRDPSIPHPRRTVCLRVLHLCLLRGLGKDGHILAHHIGFRENQPKCRVFQIHIQVRHRYDAAACAVALSTQVWRPKRNGERNKFGNMFQLEEHENSQTKRKQNTPLVARSSAHKGGHGRRRPQSTQASHAPLRTGILEKLWLPRAGPVMHWGTVASGPSTGSRRHRTTACACGSSRHVHRSESWSTTPQGHVCPLPPKATRQFWNLSSRTRPLHSPTDCPAGPSNRPSAPWQELCGYLPAPSHNHACCASCSNPCPGPLSFCIFCMPSRPHRHLAHPPAKHHVAEFQQRPQTLQPLWNRQRPWSSKSQ